MTVLFVISTKVEIFMTFVEIPAYARMTNEKDPRSESGMTRKVRSLDFARDDGNISLLSLFLPAKK